MQRPDDTYSGCIDGDETEEEEEEEDPLVCVICLGSHTEEGDVMLLCCDVKCRRRYTAVVCRGATRRRVTRETQTEPRRPPRIGTVTCVNTRRRSRRWGAARGGRG